MTTIEQIMAEDIEYSDLSVDASFTLDDVLKEPVNEYEDQIMDNLQDYFQMQEEQQQILPYDMSQYRNNGDGRAGSQSVGFPKAETKDFMEMSAKSYHEGNIINNQREHSRLADLQLVSIQQIQNMSYITLKNVSQIFDCTQSKGIGLPTCISSTGNRYMAIGTSLGSITIFEMGSKGYKTLNITDQRNIGQVTSVAISQDNRYIVGGYESGVIGIWQLSTNKLLKSQIIRQTKIIKVLFCSQNFQNFIVNDLLGYVYMYTIESKFWVTTKYQLLVDRIEGRVYYDVKYAKLQSNRHIVSLCSLDQVALISLKPNIGVLDLVKRPKNVAPTKIPNSQLGILENRDILCVSWGKSIYLYNFTQSDTSMEKVSLFHIIEHPGVIHNLQFISKNMLITVDDSQNYRVLNLPSSLSTQKCSIINQRSLQNETIYQRFLKDKKNKMIKLYSNTMLNCCFDQKNKQIFFIAKNAIYRGRLEKWTAIVQNMIGEQRNWLQTLKICVELYQGRLNIFVEPFLRNKGSMDLLCDIGRVYLKECMTDIRNKNPDLTSIKAVQSQTRQVFQITIQYFLSIGCEEYLFQKIFHELIKQTYYYQYYNLLLECIEPFISNTMINKIPYYPVFQQILAEYSSKPQLINKLVTNLDQKSLHYEDLVEICTRQKLYEALCYICAINDDFISPANKIMIVLNRHMNEREMKLMEGEEGRKIYGILKKYIEKLVKMLYPNNKQIPKDKAVIALQQIQIWISEKLTLHYFIEQHSSDFFKILQNLASSLIKHNMQHYTIDLCQQLATNFQQITNAQETSQYLSILKSLLRFMIKCSLQKQIHFYGSLVRTILQIQKQIIEKSSQTEIDVAPHFRNGMLFLDKYIIPITAEVIKQGAVNAQKRQILDFFENSLLQSTNINLQGYYLIIKNTHQQNKDGFWSDCPQLSSEQQSIAYKISTNFLNTHRKQLVTHILETNQFAARIVEKYLDLLIKWAPEPIIVYLFEKFGMEKVNQNLIEIKSEKQQYLIVRKILKFMRKKKEDVIGGDKIALLKKKSSKTASIIFGLHRESLRESQSAQSSKIEENTKQYSLNKDIIIAYIDSLCKYKKEKRVFYELSQYPSEYCNLAINLLPIAQKYKLKSCRAILLEYMLHYAEAFDLYAEVYEQYFVLNFQKLSVYEHCHGRFMASIFHLMLDLCYKMKKQQHWSHLIKYILSPFEKPDPKSTALSKKRTIRIIDKIQQIYNKKQSSNHPFLNQLQDVIQATIISASREMSMSLMAFELNKFNELLGKTFILNCLTSTMYNSYKRVESFEINKQLMISQYVEQFKQFYTNKKNKGKSVQVACSSCNQKFQDSNSHLIIISCGHAYHLKCIANSSSLSNLIDTSSSTNCKICTSKQFGDPKREDMYANLKEQKLKDTKKVEEQEEDLNQNNLVLYKCLAFDDYAVRKENEFEEFVRYYEKNIQAYKSY